MAQGGKPVRHVRQLSRLSSKTTTTDDSSLRKTGPDGSTTDEEAVRLIRRVLCAKQAPPGIPVTTSDVHMKTPLEESLPPLTSDNAVDVQLYAIIAVIMSQFVQSWYNQISPDQDFVAEVLLIIAHCTRGIEDRLRHVDLASLVLDELPAVFKRHIAAVEIACETRPPQEGIETSARARSIYHTLRPHEALSPLPVDANSSIAERESEIDWSQLLVTRLVPLVLPPEDLSNPCLDVLVSEVFSEMIMHNGVLEKATQPWLLWDGITKAIYTFRPHLRPRVQPASTSVSRLDQYGLLSSSEAEMDPRPGNKIRVVLDATVAGFWSTLQYAILVSTFLRAFAVALMRVQSMEPRTVHLNAKQSLSGQIHAERDDNIGAPIARSNTARKPFVDMKLWSCIGQLTLLPLRMPWLSGLIALLQWASLYGPLQLCSADSALDRLLSEQVHERLLNPALLPPLLHAIRSALFPDNALAPPRTPPTDDEVLQIKRECARAIVEAIPQPVRTYYFATKDEEMMKDDIEGTLALFSDAYINKHLIVAAIELIVVRLFPELADPNHGT